MKKLLTISSAAVLFAMMNTSGAQADIFDGSAGQEPLAAPSETSVPPAAGRNAVEEVPGSDWVRELVADDLLEDPDAPISADKQVFWDRFSQSTLSDACKDLPELWLTGDLTDALHMATGIERRLRRRSHDELVLFDRARVKGVIGELQRGSIGGYDSIPLGFGLMPEGESVTIRPLGDRRPCAELKTLLNLKTFKLALPFQAQRIAAMEIGEVWRLSVRLRGYVNPGLRAESGDMSATLAVRVAKTGESEVSLFRKSTETLRFRVHIRRSEAAEFILSLRDPLVDVGLGPLDRELRIRFDASIGRTKTGDILVEKILNANDPRQLEALEELLTGKTTVLSTLQKMGEVAARAAFSGDQTSVEGVQGLQEQFADPLNRLPPSSLAAVEDTKSPGKMRPGHLSVKGYVPLIWAGGARKQKTDGTIRVLAGPEAGAVIDFSTVGREKESARWKMPFAAPRNKRDAETVFTVLSIQIGGVSYEPAAYYTDRVAFLRRKEKLPQNMLSGVNDIMRFVGVQGSGTNPLTTLPADVIFKDLDAAAGKKIKDGSLDFALYLRDGVLTDIMRTAQETPERVRQAYANMRAQERGGVPEPTGYQAENFLRELQAAGRADSSKDQLGALRDFVAGMDHSLTTRQVLAVLVQLVPPGDVSAQFSAQIDVDGKGPNEVSAVYAYNEDEDTYKLVEVFIRNKSAIETRSTLTD